MERKNREYLASLALIDGAGGRVGLGVSSRVSFMGQLGVGGVAPGAITPSTPAGAVAGNGENVVDWGLCFLSYTL